MFGMSGHLADIFVFNSWESIGPSVVVGRLVFIFDLDLYFS